MEGITMSESVQEEMPKVDVDTKEEVVFKVADFMKDCYVFSEIGEKMGEHIKTKHKDGEYDSYTDVKEFCARVTADLREISQDRHIFVFFSPNEAAEVAAYKGLLPDDERKRIEEQNFESSKRENFGFQRVEVLDGNVGYLKLRYFPTVDDAAETCIGAMSFLSNTDAVIVDLRENGGGGGLVGFLSSYFFTSEKVHLSSCYSRASDSIEHSWTLPYVPGKRVPNVDLYILVSSRTFSAAEDFAYSLQQLKRAVVIGETTKGGAHPVDVLIVKGSILTQISVGNSINPITKTNWEGVGVKPDIAVPAEEALHTAYLLALKNLAKKTKDDRVKQELTSLIKQSQDSSSRTA
jgi:hypothetical protein